MASRDTIVRAVAGAGVAAVALSVALTLRGGDDNEEMIRGGATDGATTQVLTASNPSWRVPTNVTWLSVSATGAAGQGATAGFGSTVAGSFDVSPGDNLQVIVADRAGGCSGVRNSTKGVWLVVAGGGGDEGGFFQDIPGGRGGSAGTANRTGEAGGPGAVAAVTASYNYGSAPPTNAPTTLTLQQVDTILAQNSFQPRLVGLGGSGGPLSESTWLPQAPARPGGNGRSIQSGALDQVPGPGGPTDYSFYPTQDAITRASRGYWTQYSSISYSPEAPTTGGRGGRGGCGWVGGQGGSGGGWGASGGGGGGGSSYIASNAFATSTSRNTRRDIRTSVTLSYTPNPTSTITVVKPSTTTSSTTSTTSSSTTTSTSTTTTSTTTSTTSTVPATTSTVAASAETPVASTIPTTGSYKPLSVYPVRSILKLPPGTQVRSVKVETRSRPVCRPLSDIVITLKPGTCRLQVTVVNGRKRSKVAAQFVVQPS